MARAGRTLRRLCAGWTIALALLAVLELSARMAELLGIASPASDLAAVQRLMTVDADTGEPRPSLFVVDSAGTLRVRRLYAGERDFPFHDLSIPARKPPEEYRIACFGGSTTHGLDLRQEAHDARAAAKGAFCEGVRGLLQERLPGRVVTAYNLGGDALDSEKTLAVMRESARRSHFDLWITYLGHNEFVFSSELVERRPRLPRLEGLANCLGEWLALHRLATRVHRWAARSLLPHRVRAYSKENWVRAETHEATYRSRLDAYEAHLREMAALSRVSGSALVLSEVVANHELGDENPDAILFHCVGRHVDRAAAAQLRAEHEAAGRLLDAGRPMAAAAAFRSLEAIDPGYQPALLGSVRSLLAAGHRAEALTYSYRSRSAHPVPAVGTPEVTEILRRVSRQTGVALAPQVDEFDRTFLEDPERYAGLFVDDCHPTHEGHRLIAANIVAALEATGALELLHSAEVE